MNSYNIFEEENYSTVLYHAIADSEDHVRALAEERSIDLDGLIIELQRINVKDELGRPFPAKIEDAIVR